MRYPYVDVLNPHEVLHEDSEVVENIVPTSENNSKCMKSIGISKKQIGVREKERESD